MLNTTTLELRAGTELQHVKTDDDGKTTYAQVFAFHKPYRNRQLADEDDSWAITVKFTKRTAGLAKAGLTKGQTFVISGKLDFSPAGESEDGNKYEGYAFIWAESLALGQKPQSSTNG